MGVQGVCGRKWHCRVERGLYGATALSYNLPTLRLSAMATRVDAQCTPGVPTPSGPAFKTHGCQFLVGNPRNRDPGSLRTQPLAWGTGAAVKALLSEPRVPLAHRITLKLNVDGGSLRGVGGVPN